MEDRLESSRTIMESWNGQGRILEVIFVRQSDLASSQRQRIKELQKECFGHVNREELEERFIAEGLGRIFAYEIELIVGQVELHSRTVQFEGRQLSLAGIVGTYATAASCRRS